MLCFDLFCIDDVIEVNNMTKTFNCRSLLLIQVFLMDERCSLIDFTFLVVDLTYIGTRF